MIQVLKLERDRVDRALAALELLADPRRGRPRKTPLSLVGRQPSRPAPLGPKAPPTRTGAQS